VTAASGFEATPPTGTARHVADMQVSAIKQMAMLAARVPGVASLAWGLPSFRTPKHIRQAVAQALETDPDVGKYALPDGVPELRRLVAERHQRVTGATVDPDANVLVMAGNMQGLNVMFHTLLNPGDEVIVTDPGFASHVQQIRLCGGKPVYWPLRESDGWSLDVDALPGLITTRTKALVLVSPSNPTGRIFPEASLRRSATIARESGIRVLVDDPHSEFCYENHARCFNLAVVPELAETVVYLYTFSKAHAMSGWRMGYIILPPELKAQALKVHDATLICAPRPSQAAAIAALAGEQDHVREFEAVLARRRELICQRLDRLPHLFSYVRPQGGECKNDTGDHARTSQPDRPGLDDQAITLMCRLVDHFEPGARFQIELVLAGDRVSVEREFDVLGQLLGWRGQI
jgi:aminotransferase